MTAHVRMVDLDRAAPATGVVVVVDVLRAFTTAAIALQRGARRIWPVAGVEEAMAVRDATAGALAVGEVGGLPVEGFDLSNSPTEMATADIAGRTLVHRTSAGTQGIVRTAGASHRFAASFACADATAAALRALEPPAVTFVITGRDDARDGDEDLACAEYLVALMRGETVSARAFTDRIPRSTSGRLFADPALPEYPVTDLDYAGSVDLVDFALPVHVIDGRPCLARSRASGSG